MSPKLYSTVEAAKAAGIKRPTLQYWIKQGMISAPQVRLQGGKAVRLWTEADIERARKLKRTIKPGPTRRSKKKS